MSDRAVSTWSDHVIVSTTQRLGSLLPAPAGAHMAPHRLKLHADLSPVMPMYSAFLSSSATCVSDYNTVFQGIQTD